MNNQYEQTETDQEFAQQLYAIEKALFLLDCNMNIQPLRYREYITDFIKSTTRLTKVPTISQKNVVSIKKKLMNIKEELHNNIHEYFIETDSDVRDKLEEKKISQKLAEFCGFNPDEAYTRTEFSDYITTYIKNNNLKSPTDSINIMLDSKLQALFGTAVTSINYPALQKLIMVEMKE